MQPWIAKFFAFLVFFGSGFVCFAQQKFETVDLSIVIAVDVSSSVDDLEYALQKQGVINALLSDGVKGSINGCEPLKVAITYLEWSGVSGGYNIHQLVPWHLVKNKQDLLDLAAAIQATNRQSKGDTNIAEALLFSTQLFATLPYESQQNIILLSSDGLQNEPIGGSWGQADYVGPGEVLISYVTFADELKEVSKKIGEQGISISSLVIGNDHQETLRKYFPVLNGANKEDLLGYYFSYYVSAGDYGMTEFIETYDHYSESFRNILLRHMSKCLM